MALRDVMRSLASKTEAGVLEVFRRHQTGRLTDEQLTQLVAVLIARANSRAVGLADLAIATHLTRQLRRDVLPLGLVREGDDTGRLTVATTTVMTAQIADADTPEALIASQSKRLARLARAEPLNAGQDAVHAALQGRKDLVRGWTRSTGKAPCPLCQSLADGTVLPVDAPMARHTGCSCYQTPVLTT